MLAYSRFRWGLMLCLLAAVILSGCRPQPQPVQRPTPPPGPEAPEPTVNAEESWDQFIAEARTRCKPEEGCTIDYEKLHEYDGRHFGVTVIGYKDSEYYVNLYRLDPETGKWVDSPRSTPEDGYEQIDVPATSKQWDVPETTIRAWIDEAETTVREIYSKRQ